MPLPFPFTVYGANRSSAPTDDCFTYCYGGDWVQGKVGNYGVKLISSDSPKNYIDINNYSDIHALEKGTISMWVNPNISGESYPTLVAAGDNAVSNTYFEFYIDQTDSKVKYAHYNAGSSNTNILNDTAITANTWSHVALTSDGTTAKVYLNGVNNTVSKGGFGNNGDWFADNSGLDNLTLGIMEYNGGTLSFPYSGSMDEVAIWDVPLTDAQISLLSTGSARADSITPPENISGYGDWNTTYKKIGTYGIGPFNGSTDVISLTPSSSMAFAAGDAWSWSGWYYPTNLGATTYNFLFSQGPSGGALFAHGYGTKIYFGEARNPYGSNGYIQKHTVAGELTLNAWNHVVITCNGNGTSTNSSTRAAAYNCYVNATASSIEATDSNTQLIAGAGQLGNLHMGNRVANSLGLNGYIDDTAMFDVSLDVTAVAQIYESGSADVGAKASNVSSSALVGYWDMENDGPGSTTVSGAFGQHGVMGGTLAGGTSTTGSLLLYYDFEIGDNNPVSGNFPGNTTVYDVVTASFHPATAHTGTMTNMSVADFGAWGQGKLGKYSFLGDGVNDFVEIASSSLLPVGDGSDSFSVAFWANNVDALSSYETIISRHTSDATIWSDGWSIQYDNAGNDEMHFSVGEYDNIANHAEIVWDSAANTTFRHVVATYDHSANVSQLWLNGVKGTDGVKSAASPLPGTGRVQIGGLGTTSAYNWGGNIDEVSIWSGVLDTDSIASLAAGAKANAITPSTATLTAYYDMECNGPGSAVIKDLGANELSGTLMNSSIGTCGAG